MSSTTRMQRKYDHRLRDLIRSTGDINHATERGIPRSTARGWLTGTPREGVSVDEVGLDVVKLQQEVLALRRRLERLIALLRIVILLWKFSGFSLTSLRIPDRARKLTLLRAIDRSHSVLPLRVLLRVLRLSHSRYHAWKQEGECGLDDVPSCPRSSPQQLTPVEMSAIQEMVTSDEYRHVPTGTLARLAQRLRKVFASPTTWYRLVRRFRWRRPRKRVHPSQPKVGIRAFRPNEIWHVDTTLLRLLDGSRAYLHAVIDNFSRRILAWKVLATFDPSTTAQLLLNASTGLVDQKPTLLADGGVENVNGAVDKLVQSGLLRRLLAQTEISYSNSLIESWWRILKHQWLFLNTLDTVGTLTTLIAFYVNEHNTRLPHSAFRGQTPDEMYLATGTHIPGELEAARKAARRARMDANRKRSCPKCEPLVQLSP
ncbi:MAG: transposase [Planctomycetaceae bacterium]|nr:transposase [Planctomycetaceae bacterium]